VSVPPELGDRDVRKGASAPPSRLAALAPVGRIGRYEVLGRIGAGGMAEVFLARATGPREVARHLVVKRLLPHVAEDAGKVDAFVQEARLTSRLSHPNLCAVHDFGAEGGNFHLAMEWARGPSLRRLITHARGRGGIPVPIAARIFAGLGAALHHAHVARGDDGKPLGIVHRDVTPENVIVGWNGVPKLIDFGIAKSVVDPRKTAEGVLKGKMAYIPPEQYRGEPIDARSDVFALALCAYETLSGSGPLYERDNEFETMAAILLGDDPPSLRAARPDVPEEIDAVVRRGLHKDREKRWQSADAMARALEAWLATSGSPAGEREVAEWLSTLFPGEANSEPKLDRRPLDMPKQRSRADEISGMQLLADADIAAESLEAQGRRGRAAMIIAMLVLAASALAVIGWVAFGRG
jgi:serine/threonine protein kinase